MLQHDIGRALFYNGNREEAMGHYYEALRRFEELEDNREIVPSNHYVAELYYHSDVPDSCRKYASQARSLAKGDELRNTFVRSSCYLAAVQAKYDDFEAGVTALRARSVLFPAVAMWHSMRWRS